MTHPDLPLAVPGGLRLSALPDAPVHLEGAGLLTSARIGFVEIFTAAEQRGRTSQALVRSAVGQRLRFRRHTHAANVVEVVQGDAVTGLEVESRFSHIDGAQAWSVRHLVRNTSDNPVTLTAVSTIGVTLAGPGEALDELVVSWARTGWLEEFRFIEEPLRAVLPRLDLPLHGQDGRSRFAVASHGSWSTGEHLPLGVIAHPDGRAVGWQIESSAGWEWELTESLDGAVLSAAGPTDLEHHFAHRLAPGASFVTETATLVLSDQGRDGAIAQLTRARRAARRDRTEPLPIVYNDFMNTLMGDPSTEKLEPLIDAAAESGAEVFCIDAGWFAPAAGGEWWSSVGAWTEGAGRFRDGLRAVIDRIHARGMRSGLWLEPEVVGVDSPVAASLPREAFFRRFGEPVVEDRRYQLDFRHPAAIAHLDAVVDRLVAKFGISFLKLDYNINPGPGTDVDALGAGDGLLGHARAYRGWLEAILTRHPGLLVENCSSGAMRADYGMLAVAHVQSTTDQQNAVLSAPILASAPAAVLPEQCANWAYPAVGMSEELTGFALLGAIVGRFWLSGFLDQLDSVQRGLIDRAITVHRELRAELASAEPFWPIGLPGWDDSLIVLGLHLSDSDLLAVWSRSQAATTAPLPVSARGAELLFPFSQSLDGGTPLSLDLPPGPAARLVRFPRTAT